MFFIGFVDLTIPWVIGGPIGKFGTTVAIGSDSFIGGFKYPHYRFRKWVIVISSTNIIAEYRMAAKQPSITTPLSIYGEPLATPKAWEIKGWGIHPPQKGRII